MALKCRVFSIILMQLCQKKIATVLQALKTTATMNTPPRVNPFDLPLFGLHHLNARVHLALPLIPGRHSTRCTRHYTDKTPYDAFYHRLKLASMFLILFSLRPNPQR